jgi:hypothetical protein
MVSFTCAVILLFVLQCFCSIEKERLRPWGLALCGVTAVVCIYLNAGPLMRMFYTEDVVRRADEMIAVRIIDELETLPGVSEGKAVIFIGSREGLRNPSAFEEDDDIYLCHSVFEFDYVFEPKSYFSTCRILGYFQTFGFSYTLPEADMMNDAYARSLEMTCWPLDGSIQEFDDFVIVKLNNN